MSKNNQLPDPGGKKYQNILVQILGTYYYVAMPNKTGYTRFGSHYDPSTAVLQDLVDLLTKFKDYAKKRVKNNRQCKFLFRSYVECANVHVWANFPSETLG